MCVGACVRLSMFIYACVWLCVCMCVCVCVCVYTHTYACMHTYIHTYLGAELNGRAFKSVALRPLACLDCGFESLRSMDCPSLVLVSVVYCQIEVFASGLSLVQRSPTECGVSEYDPVALIIGRP